MGCSFCGGFGHGSHICSTIRIINRWAKSSKTLKAVWGKRKGLAKSARIEKAIRKGVLGRKR